MQIRTLGLIAATTVLSGIANADFVYSTFTGAAGLNLQGDTVVQGGSLVITPAGASKLGSAWVGAKQDVAGDWSTTFQFRISAQVAGGADGFVFMIQNQAANHFENTPAARGGGMGYNGMRNVLVFEFDTWMNPRAFDPNDNHVSVLTMGAKKLASSEEYSLGNSTKIPNLSDGNVHTAKITSIGGVLRVYVDNLDSPVIVTFLPIGDWLDLSGGQAWVGFAGSTGVGSWQKQEILGWSFSTGR